MEEGLGCGLWICPSTLKGMLRGEVFVLSNPRRSRPSPLSGASMSKPLKYSTKTRKAWLTHPRSHAGDRHRWDCHMPPYQTQPALPSSFGAAQMHSPRRTEPLLNHRALRNTSDYQWTADPLGSTHNMKWEKIQGLAVHI